MIRLLWLDLETTGLDPENDAILAIGAVFTDAHLVCLADSVEIVLAPTSAQLAGMSDFVTKMHMKSGLLLDCQSPSAVTFEKAYQEILDYVTSYAGDRNTTYLAGSSVHFDRSFLAEQMPLVLTHVSHRHVDVSTLDIVAKSWGEEISVREAEHTPLSDLDRSQAIFRHFGSRYRPRKATHSNAPAGAWKRG
jgi:oligoribonuclease